MREAKRDSFANGAYDSDDSDDDDGGVIASTALSFGGVASSAVVGHGNGNVGGKAESDSGGGGPRHARKGRRDKQQQRQQQQQQPRRPSSPSPPRPRPTRQKSERREKRPQPRKPSPPRPPSPKSAMAAAERWKNPAPGGSRGLLPKAAGGAAADGTATAMRKSPPELIAGGGAANNGTAKAPSKRNSGDLFAAFAAEGIDRRDLPPPRPRRPPAREQSSRSLTPERPQRPRPAMEEMEPGGRPRPPPPPPSLTLVKAFGKMMAPVSKARAEENRAAAFASENAARGDGADDNGDAVIGGSSQMDEFAGDIRAHQKSDLIDYYPDRMSSSWIKSGSDLGSSLHSTGEEGRPRSRHRLDDKPSDRWSKGGSDLETSLRSIGDERRPRKLDPPDKRPDARTRQQQPATPVATRSLRQSFTKAQSSPFSTVSRLTEMDDDQSRQSASVRSEGGRRRRRKKKQSSAVEKLKLAQAKLEKGGDGAIPKEDFRSLLESSIQDLMAAQRDDDREEEKEDRKRLSRSQGSGSYSHGGSSYQNFEGKEVRATRTTLSKSERNLRGDKSKSSRSSRSLSARPERSSRSVSSRSEGDKRRRRRKSSRSGSRSRDGGGGSSVDPSTMLTVAPVPGEARQVLATARGGEALPREEVVSGVVRGLVSRVASARESASTDDDEDDDDGGGGRCVAVLSPPSTEGVRGGWYGDEDWGGGVGKTTVAALACLRGDVRTRYCRGMAWLDMCNQSLGLDYERYTELLSDMCRKIGVQPHRLRLGPAVRTPGEDKKVSDLRMRDSMQEAKAGMGRLLSSLQRKSHKKPGRSSDSGYYHTTVLVVLDDIAAKSDIEWFQFRRGGMADGEQINDLLVTSQLSQMEGAMTITVPPLETKEALRLFLAEAGLPINHPAISNPTLRKLAKESCALHPLTIKFAGRWLGMKRATSGGKKGIEEILAEIDDAMKDALENDIIDKRNKAEVMHALLNRATSPLVKGKETKIVRLCFTAFVKVFYDDVAKEEDVHRSASGPSSSPVAVTMETAQDFFLRVVESEKEILSKEDAFFQSNGRQASKLVPEILGALGVFNITRHTNHTGGGGNEAGSDEKHLESTIHIDHDMVRKFSRVIMHEDVGMHRLVINDAEQRWNEAYVQSYLHQNAKSLWDDVQPNRSQKYALEKMPMHMIRAGMLEDTKALLSDASFIRGRFWSLGWTEGTRVHAEDAEALCRKLQQQGYRRRRQLWRQQQKNKQKNGPGEKRDDIGEKENHKDGSGSESLGDSDARANGDGEGDSTISKLLVSTCKQLESVLMEEVARESPGPRGQCTTLEAGRCLHEICLSLARMRLWSDAASFGNSCTELVGSNLGPDSELVAALLYNESVMRAEANEFEEAERIIGDCLDIRVKTCGTESIQYVRALCQLGDILSLSSDYSAAESCFNKSIGLLKVMPARYHLDFGVALYKLGRNQHRRGGFLDEALHCYEEALEFEKDELGTRHIYVSSSFIHMADILLDKEDAQQAKHTFLEALDVLSKTDYNFSSHFELKIKFAIAEGKLRSIEGKSEECIKQYEIAIALIKKNAPFRKRKMAGVLAMIAAELEKNRSYLAAGRFYEESVVTMKSIFGPMHLDIAETLVNLSGVNSALGAETMSLALHQQATACMEEAITILKSRLGECEELAITLTIFGAHLKAIGSHDKAELAYTDAVRILKSLEGDRKLLLADAYLGLADVMTATAKYNDAMDLYNRCLEIQQSVFGIEHDDIASTLLAAGVTNNENGTYQDALGYLAKSLVMRVKLHGEDHPLVGDTYDVLGLVEANAGNLDTSLRRLEDGLKVRKAVGDRLSEADTLVNIGNLHRDRSEFDLALQRYDDCVSIRVSELGEGHRSIADALMAKGNVYSDMEKPEEALALYKEALQILSVQIPNGPSVASLLMKAGMIYYRAENLESALSHLERAVELYRHGGEGYESEIIIPLFVIGTIQNTLENAEEAHKAWNDAFVLSRKMGDMFNEIHQVLAQLLQSN